MHLFEDTAADQVYACTFATLQETIIGWLTMQDVVLKAGQLLLANPDADEDSPGGRQMKVYTFVNIL